jgi:hypothetical protein
MTVSKDKDLEIPWKLTCSNGDRRTTTADA